MKGLYKLYSSLQIYVDSSFQIIHCVTLSTSSDKYPFIKFDLHGTFSNASQFGFPWELDGAHSLQQIRALLLFHQSVKMPVPQALGHMAPYHLEKPSKNGGFASTEPQVGAVNQSVPASALSACCSDSSCHSFECE